MVDDQIKNFGEWYQSQAYLFWSDGHFNIQKAFNNIKTSKTGGTHMNQNDYNNGS
jgi:hypothetical protein